MAGRIPTSGNGCTIMEADGCANISENDGPFSSGTGSGQVEGAEEGGHDHELQDAGSSISTDGVQSRTK